MFSFNTLRFAATAMLALLLAIPAVARPPRPRLVLFIVVDQLRGDMPWRFQERFGRGGLRYLMDEGVAYRQAHYRHSTTFTATGHATLSTGGHAAQHGLCGNDWYDQSTKQRVYCVEDDQHRVLGQVTAPHSGTSPRNLASSTFGDVLVLATEMRSRVYSVSLKDRGAIIPGGHLGKAFWYSKDTGRFVSSTYYFDDYPEWVKEWNAADHAKVYENAHWDLSHDKSSYLYADRDDRPSERSYKHLGRTFPHPLRSDNPKDFYAALQFTPMGDELTLAFAEQLVNSAGLGSSDWTDVLCVSLSATDYIGHAFGPNSLEAEDNLLRLDRSLAKFFEFIDQRVGLDATLVVLSSDHGVDASPEYTLSLGMAAGRHRPDEFIKSINESLQGRFRTDRDLVHAFWNPSLYLDVDALREFDLAIPVVERALADEVLRLPGFAYTLTRSDLLAGRVAADPIIQKMQRAFHPQRSGNVLVVQSPSWYLYPDADVFSAMHGSPYPYDTYVPILFAGAGIKPQVVDREVAPQDVASTVTAFLGLQPPSGSTGKPLVEVLDARK